MEMKTLSSDNLNTSTISLAPALKSDGHSPTSPTNLRESGSVDAAFENLSNNNHSSPSLMFDDIDVVTIEHHDGQDNQPGSQTSSQFSPPPSSPLPSSTSASSPVISDWGPKRENQPEKENKEKSNSSQMPTITSQPMAPDTIVTIKNVLFEEVASDSDEPGSTIFVDFQSPSDQTDLAQSRSKRVASSRPNNIKRAPDSSQSLLTAQSEFLIPDPSQLQDNFENTPIISLYHVFCCCLRPANFEQD